MMVYEEAYGSLSLHVHDLYRIRRQITAISTQWMKALR